MTFTPSVHDYVGADMGYAPRGFSPWMPSVEFGTNAGGAILWAGERVSVISAWERDYLPGAPILLYVESHGTGERTHVTAADLLPA